MAAEQSPNAPARGKTKEKFHKTGYIVRSRVNGKQLYQPEYICSLTEWARLYTPSGVETHSDCQWSGNYGGRHSRSRCQKQRDYRHMNIRCWGNGQGNGKNMPKDPEPHKFIAMVPQPGSNWPCYGYAQPNNEPAFERRPRGDLRRRKNAAARARTSLHDDPVEDGKSLAYEFMTSLPSDRQANVVVERTVALQDSERLFWLGAEHDGFPLDDGVELALEDLAQPDLSFTVRYMARKKGKGKIQWESTEGITDCQRDIDNRETDVEKASHCGEECLCRLVASIDDIGDFEVVYASDEEDWASVAESWIEVGPGR